MRGESWRGRGRERKKRRGQELLLQANEINNGECLSSEDREEDGGGRCGGGGGGGAPSGAMLNTPRALK